MLKDRYDSPVTTTSAKARDAYVDGVDRFLGARDGVEAGFEAAIAADDSFALPFLGLARMHVVCGRRDAAMEALAAARARSGGVSEREAQQIDITADMLEGRGAQAYTRIRAHVDLYPRDVMLAQTCTSVFGLIGFSGLPGREAEQLAYTTALKPHYGDDWWFLTQHAFAQMEAGQTGPAKANIERAVTLNPDSANCAHVRSHLYYETGETTAGFAFIQDFMERYPESGFMHCHMNWHVALWALEQGDIDRMWQVYETAIAPNRATVPPLNILSDSVAILYRAGLAGLTIDTARWQSLSDYAHATFARPGLAFADVHAALAHAMAGERARLLTVIEGAKGPAQPVVQALASAFGALCDGAPEQAVELLGTVMSDHERIGGSRAQRDLIEFALASALQKSGHVEEARRTLAMRRPHVAHDHAVAGVTH